MRVTKKKRRKKKKKKKKHDHEGRRRKPVRIQVQNQEPETPNSHGARPVHLIITMIKWFRTSRLSIKHSLPLSPQPVLAHQATHPALYEALGQLGQDEPASG